MSKNKKPYKDIDINKKSDGVVEITGEVPVEVFEKHQELVLNEIQKDFEAPGFRKGKAPKSIVKEEVGESHILGQAANAAIRDAFNAIVQNEEVGDLLSAPQANITKLAAGNPLGFKIFVATEPEFKLPNYTKIGESISKTRQTEFEVEDKEVENVIKQVQAMRAVPTDDGEAGKVPELTEEFVQTLGDFDSVEDFKKKVKENVHSEKVREEKEKKREEIVERLIEETKLEIPEMIVEQEAQTAKERFKQQLKEKGTTMEDYLEHVGKTEKEVDEIQRENIEKQFKMRLILKAIAEEEEIEPDPKVVNARLQVLQQQHRDQDPEVLKEYIKTNLTNEKVLRLLEGEPEEE